MLASITLHRFLTVISFGIVAIGLVNPPAISAQERFLLSGTDMPGYELERQSPFEWIVGPENQMHNVIQQKWHIAGGEKGEDIFISYCEFTTASEALQGTAYAATRSFSWPYIWGSLDGSISRDGSWIGYFGNYKRALFFVRGNVGIQASKPTGEDLDATVRQMLMQIVDKLVNKIEPNLSPEILALENSMREARISLADFEKITNPVINSALMASFSPHTIWDSKWQVDSASAVMGIRKEWKNEATGAVVGIDLCQFQSSSAANQASELMSRNTHNFDSKLDLDDRNAFGGIVDGFVQRGIDRSMSIVGVKDNLALHLYQYDSTGIDTTFFRSLLDTLAEQIGNF